MGNYEVYQAVMEASRRSEKGITVNKTYQIALDILKDEKKAEKFMLSELGGYTKGEINKAKYAIEYNQKYYRQNALNMG